MVSKNGRYKWVKGAIAVAVGTLVAGSALADNGKHRGWDQRRGGYSDVDYARVVDVDPIVRRIRVSEPRRECYQETRYDERRGYDRREYDNRRYETRNGGRPAAGAMILGGLIGAAVGNQIGSGDGRRAATVAGAIIGSAIGHDNSQRGGRYADGSRYDDRDEGRPYSVERCDTRYEDSWEERIEGYRVTYEYQGRHGTMTLPYDPGPRVRVRVDVRPDEG